MNQTEFGFLCAHLQKLYDGVVWLGEDQSILFINQSGLDIFGYTNDEIYSLSITALIPARYRDRHTAFFSSFQEDCQKPTMLVERREIIGLRKSGEEFPAEATVSQDMLDGRPIFLFLLRDMSSYARTQEKLLRSQNRYLGLVESQSNMIVCMDCEGRFTFVNQAFCQIYGKSSEQLIGSSYREMIHPEEYAHFTDFEENLLKPPHRGLLEQYAQTSEGMRWHEWEFSLIRNEQAKMEEVQGVGRDITERKRTQSALIAQRDLAMNLAEISDIDTALDYCLRAAIQVSRTDCGGVYVVDRNSTELVLVLSTGLSEDFIEKVSKYPAGSPQWQKVMAGAPIYSRFKDLETPNPSLMEREGLREFLVLPILHNGSVIACFNLASHQEVEISHESQAAVQALVMQMGNTLARIQVEEDLKTSQKGLQTLFDTIVDFIFVMDQQGNVIKVNKQVIDRLGYSEEELIGMSVLELHPPELRQEEARIVAEMIAGRLNVCPLEIQTKDGRRIPVETKVNVGKWGNQTILIGLTRDISERVEAQAKLTFRSNFEDLLTRISTRFINLRSCDVDYEINQALREIGEFEQVDRNYIFLIDPVRSVMSNTHEWCAEGIEPQIENLQDLPIDIFPWWLERMGDNQPIVLSTLEELPEQASQEKEILQAQDIQSIAVIPLMVNQLLQGFVGFDAVRSERAWEQENILMLHQFGNILTNLLERQRTEDALRQSEARNAALLDAIPDDIFRIDSDGRILDAVFSDNKSPWHSKGEFKTMSIFDYLDTDLARIGMEAIQQALVSGKSQTTEYQMFVDNQLQYYEARVVASGKDEVIAIVRNTSEKARLEQMKTDFISRATHDLRTPLTTILLMVRLLEGDCTPEERKEFWQVLKDELEKERLLIEDLLTVGRLESNRWNVRKQPVNPIEPLMNAINSIAPQAVSKQVEINLIETPTDFQVMGDAPSLQQVFTNLLNNAVKFTATGGWVNICSFAQGGKGYFQIRDNGMGIPPEDLPNLFSRFFRSKNAIEQEVPGSGIGLFIVKSIIEHFDGQIRVESQLGSGTMMEFWLPLTA